MTTTAESPATPPRRRWRTVDGIVLLDKPRGLSSTQALQRVRRLLQAEKAGHAGTLDPMATGMLPLCFGQATKACGSLLGRRKAYRATIRLGLGTDTGDADGRVVVERPVAPFDPARLEAVLASLRGNRLQVPPMYSALKRDGRPLYELARRGESVDRAPRPISIESLSGRVEADQAVAVEVVCSKGTYVRVLGEEIASGLGTVGHLASLRRLWVEPFGDAAMATLECIEADCAAAGTDETTRPAWLRPVDCGFTDLPAVRLGTTPALHLRQGREVDPPANLDVGGPLLRAYDDRGAFLGLVRLDAAGRLRVERLFVPGAG